MIWRSVAGRFLGILLLSLSLAVHSLAAEDNAIVAESLRAMFQSGKADTGSAAANASRFA